MPAVQMNVRIDDALKEAGDAVFARHSLTPTQVVRATWEYAEKHQQPPAFLTEDEAGSDDERARRVRAVSEGSGLAVRLAREAGIACGPVTEDYEALRAAAYRERYADLLGSEEA